MTTIVWDGKNLCSDSQATGSYIQTTPTQKIFKIKQNDYNIHAIKVVALADQVMDFKPAIDWLVYGADKPDGEFTVCGIALCDDKIICFDTECTGFMKLSLASHEALGSGAKFAMGAMLGGASASRALSIAARLDSTTDDNVQRYCLKTGRLTGPFSKSEFY